MDTDVDASMDERSIELSSIEAIFPELKLDSKNPFRATLDIPVNPEKPLKIYFQASVQSAPPASVHAPTPLDLATIAAINPAAAKVDVHELSHLPPLTVNLCLPEGYPSTIPPQVEVSSHPRWIPKSTLRSLVEACESLWKDAGQDQIVYAYIDHLQQWAESAFDVGMGNDLRFELPGELKISLLDFDLRKRKEHFDKETFHCEICLEPKKGLHCHRLSFCGHVFCVSCLQDFYNNAITEGDVDGVKCLSPGCGKDEVQDTPGKRKRKFDRTLNPSELLQIPIAQEQVQRYVSLKRKKKLEADENTIYCPRQWCQGAAKSKKHPKPVDIFSDFVESDSEPEAMEDNVNEPAEDTKSGTRKAKKKKTKVEKIPMSERLAVCEDCDFAFCSVCKKGWHGELAFCNPRRKAELDEEEKATLAYLEQYSTPCPTCKAPAQKTMGCNHMICFQCRSHFCYLCSAYLMPENPYGHFNDFKSTCYMRLWELEGGDGADAGQGFAGGAGNAVPWNPEDFNSDSDTDSDADDDFTESDDDDDEPIAVVEEPGNAIPVAEARNMHIEIVNFAGNGLNQRIELPNRPNHAIPPPAPNPPQRGGQGQRGHRRGGHIHAQDRIGHRGAVEGHAARNQAALLRRRGPVDQAQAAPGRANALDRFLQLALNDQEDEWDSDELDDDDFDEQPRLPARNGRRAAA